MFKALTTLFRSPNRIVEGVIGRIGAHQSGSDTTGIAFTLVGGKQVYYVYCSAPATDYPVGLSKPGERVRFHERRGSRVRSDEFRNEVLERELDLSRCLPKDGRLAFSPLRQGAHQGL